ncbi:MAG: hypothetical protein UW15_C0001G0025 [Parcubacteria group bacterium GW2011_GWC1_44_10]|nr:MAG: hypothetical protein UW15_C0001G0025 [Parcubacteria group bacterium GW2011_GWC1_44_10]
MFQSIFRKKLREMETNDDIKNLLAKNLESTEKALGILRKIHRAMLWQRIFAFAKWVVIAALVVVGFLQLQPLIRPFLDNYQNILKIFEQINTLPKK